MKHVLLVVGFLTYSFYWFMLGVKAGFEHAENKLNVSIKDVENSLKDCEETLVYRNESCVVVFDIVKQSEVE